MKIDRIDHIVLTVRDIEQTIQFYTEVLGMKAIVFGTGRKALTFGNQKINLHEKGKEFEPKANFPTCGSADLCFIATTKIEAIKAELANKEIEIEGGIVERTGAIGKIRSIYLRDPDDNLIELSNYE
ncbi:MAG: VOC family protein [Bacteroidota bacterium]